MAEQAARSIEIQVPSYGATFRAEMLEKQNPALVEAVWNALPVESVLGHVVVSGEGIWIPTRIIHVAPSVMVTRTPGSLYFYAPGQTICFTYGEITESAKVNKFAQVGEKDIPVLQEIGRKVYSATVANARREFVRVMVRRGK